MPVTDTNSQLPAPIEPNPPRRPKLWPLWLLIVAALALCLALGLWNWQHWQRQQMLQQALAHVQATNQSLQQRLSDRSGEQADRLQALEQNLSSQQNRMATQQRQLDHTARELLAAGNRTRTDWLLAESEYLLRIANQRLLIEKDIRGALAALEEADKVLRESDDIGVYPVRQQLAKERLALKAITDVDRTGLYLTLEAAIGGIHQLTDQNLINDRAPGFAASQPDTLDEAQPGPLAQAWQRVKATLSNVVVVRRLDEPVRPLLSPEQSAYARLNMQLMLEEAEMAVLRGNQILYQRALAKARQALEQWYDATDPRVAALLSTLTGLADRHIDPELPDISQSLQLLKARLAGRLNGDNDTAGGES
ncbi:uroporphyrinogen-III C-methyltransferase [Marinobacter sp. SS21]|uniref:uroporphyrinogen-III C-methyltransferase n=1 Tax=Marinobacter sp. SS21 TaxID=2979460 RepID=UPI00232B8888|nr:uroporphyrinogen-III C-methyltransferase [Marinobacter sp. SS21]MDC0661323.1 uroporphyrinogen-III C-methyltransferase [Marinobacter sp. SS21]